MTLPSSDLGWIDYPRINFRGQFRANVSSDNNSKDRYARSSELSHEQYKEFYVDDFNWGPWGDGGWSFDKCTVVNAFTENAAQDTSLINSTVNPADNKIVGRLVDLDPDKQSVSFIYGFKINITPRQSIIDDDSKTVEDISRISAGNNFILKANYEASAFQYMWQSANGSGMSAFRANYVSVLTECEFGENLLEYPALAELRAYAAINDNQLSIRFIVDAYSPWIESPETFNSGRMFGVIGVYSVEHPRRSLKYGRVCTINLEYPGPGPGQMVTIKYDKESKILHMDLANAIPSSRGEKEINGKVVGFGWPANINVGEITLWCTDGTNEVQIPGVIVPVEDYYKERTVVDADVFGVEYDSNFNADKWIENCGIYSFEVDIPALQLSIDYENNPFIVRFENANLITNISYTDQETEEVVHVYYRNDSSEAEGGYFLQGQDMQMRLGTSGEYGLYGNNIESLMYVSRFGVPITTLSRAVLLVSTAGVQGKGDDAPNEVLVPGENDVPPYPEWNVSPYLPTLEDSDTSGKFLQVNNGFYCVKITAPNTLIINGSLPRATVYLSTLVYNITCVLTDEDNITANGDFGAVLVFNESKPLPDIASWQPNIWADDATEWKSVLDNMFGGTFTPYIRPIFRQYANLYPVMRKILNLDDYQDVTTKLSALLRAFNSDFKSAHYMPVSRDLSGQMVRFINSWLMNPIVSPLFIDESSEIGGFDGIIDSVDDLKIYLQLAIELEISTLPPYLSALYSIEPNSTDNREIIGIIRTIVHQEMSHMALACNLLRSIGGTPDIASHGVVTRTSYPRTGLITSRTNGLNIDVLPTLELALLPYSDAALEIFMKLEAPTAYGYVDDNTTAVDNTEEAYAGSSIAVTPIMKRSTKTLISVFKAKALRNASKAAVAREKKVENIILKRILFKKFNNSSTLKRNVEEEKDDVKEEKENGMKSSAAGISLKEMEDILDVVSPVTKSDVPSIGPTGAAEYSIGAFYELIRKGFRFLTDHGANNDIFVVTQEDAIDSQLGPSDMEGVTPVYDLITALQAIETIVTEGEGTSFTDLWAEGDSLSHFHRFLELLVRHPILGVSVDKVGGFFEYEFAEDIEIPFNADDVSSESTAWDWLQPGASQENADDHRVIRFNENYGRLLISLQSILGEGDITQLGGAIAIMRQMQVDFNECVRPPVKSGQASVAPNWVPPTSLIGILS